MKMKKALSIILGGTLVVTSSSFIFANNSVKLPSETQKQAIQSETSVENPTKPTVTIEVLDEIIDKADGEIVLDVEDKEFEEELLELIEDILSELEEEVDEEEVDEDEVEESDEDEDEDKEEDDEDKDKEEEDEDDEDNQIVLEDLYRKLLKYQLVYDRVPAEAKPAIEKNMKTMQLKIVEHMVKMNEDLEKLIPEINMEEIQKELSNLKEQLENENLTEEEKQQIMDSITALEMKIANHEEIVKLVDFVKENENWHKELKNNIHKEFKEEKAKVKAEDKLAKEEIKKARKEVQDQMKANKKTDNSTEKDVKIIEEKEVKNDKNNKPSNEKTDKKAHPVKESHPGNGKGKNK